VLNDFPNSPIGSIIAHATVHSLSWSRWNVRFRWS